ncbi:Enoyl-CoA hydratase [Mortierella sp. GBA30]|nr:Enoyl-CoA hydratase [Mortierella sp. GBA30]
MVNNDSTRLVLVEKRSTTTIITINRPHKRNCVNGPTARALYQAFLDFDTDSAAKVAILTGADLAAIKNQDEANPMSSEWPETLPGPIGPMGPSRMVLSKPVIAAISGFAVAGGLELALWCDIRIVDTTATLGVFCRMRGVPLIDGGTVRLPQVVGRGVAMDLMLTGRAVKAQEALRIQLATCYPPSYNAVCETPSLEQALALAAHLAEHPQTCMRNDRLSTHSAHPIREAMLREFALGVETLASGEFLDAIEAFFKQGVKKDAKLYLLILPPCFHSMVTMQSKDAHTHQHWDGNGHNYNHPHAQLAQTFHEKQGSSSHLEKPVASSFKPGAVDMLLSLPEPELASVKEAFVKRTIPRKNLGSTLPRPEPVPLPKISFPKDENPRTGDISLSSAALDPSFRIGFSKIYGHAVELNKDNILEHSKKGKVESGTFVLENDELPYACVIEPVWKGKLCEECLRQLPEDKSKIMVCPGCSEPSLDGSGQSIAPGQQSRFEKAKEEGGQSPTLFCSHRCRQAAWNSWHGYECAFQEELVQLGQRTRLALRVYWKICCDHRHTLSESSASNLSPPTNAVAGLSLDSSSPRITDANGSGILPTQLCDNFTQLDNQRAMSFIMTGYYLQQLLELTEDAALKLARLQALVQFNSFSIKARVNDAREGSGAVSHVEDYSIGSALYLLTSMFNHSCAPNAMVVFGEDGRNSRNKLKEALDTRGHDPRAINVLTTSALKVDNNLPVLVEISYGPQGGRMATEERRAYLRRSHLFECNCSACNDRYAETITKKIYKCPKNGYACRPMTEKDVKCATCGAEVDMVARRRIHQLMGRLLAESQDPSLSLDAQLTLLKTLENAQAKVFVNTCMLYGNTCDQLAMIYAQSGDLTQSIDWCKKALKVVVVHFPHDSIEVAQETLKLAGLLFNNSQPKEAVKQIRIAITLYKGHYGAGSNHPDLLELYEMERILKPIVGP